MKAENAKLYWEFAQMFEDLGKAIRRFYLPWVPDEYTGRCTCWPCVADWVRVNEGDEALEVARRAYDSSIRSMRASEPRVSDYGAIVTTPRAAVTFSNTADRTLSLSATYLGDFDVPF